MRQVLTNTDFLSGVLFVALGGGFALISFNYGFGTPSEMGSGYFPRVLGFGVLIVGLVLVVKAFLRARARGDAVVAFPIRPTLLVLGSLAAFALLLRPLGLAITTLALIGVAGFATPDRKLREIAMLAIGMSVFACVVFVELLKVPLPLWPRGF
ncbi:MAG: hypothetical protein K0R85_681 [Devosia sp.]|nr:hypothetical protein [Devosia sp.]